MTVEEKYYLIRNIFDNCYSKTFKIGDSKNWPMTEQRGYFFLGTMEAINEVLNFVERDYKNEQANSKKEN